jgi:hypothetical protein
MTIKQKKKAYKAASTTASLLIFSTLTSMLTDAQ